MPNKFRDYLRKDLGLAESRVYDLDTSIDRLHSAICLLDTDNADIVKSEGLLALLKTFCKIEELRDITSILFYRKIEKTETLPVE
jgi:hypothetical protein